MKLTDSTIDANQRFFEKREDVPTHAYTMGIGSILQLHPDFTLVADEAALELVKDLI